MFNKTFFKFFFGFLGIITAGLMGIAFSNHYFETNQNMIATTNEAR